VLFPENVLSNARALFPYTQQPKIYLNHAGTCPLSTRVVEAMTGYLQRRSEGVLETYPEDQEMVQECRSLVARLVNAESPDRISLQFSTSDAINVVASGVAWKTGDRVLLSSVEFPANVYPYLNLTAQGVELDFMSVPDGRVTADLIASRITDRTRLVALSAVQFLSGYRADLKRVGELCRDKGIVFAVDGIQAVGAVCLDVQKLNIDFLAAGGQKWQMSPHGTGFLYITEELQSRLRQKNLGWLSVEDPWSFHKYDQPLAPTARRYEGGSMNMPCLWGMHAALSTLLEFNTEKIESHILSITGELIQGLQHIEGVTMFTPVPDAERAGIVTISLDAPLNVCAVFDKLRGQGVTASLRDGKLRYSPHFYNSSDDIRKVVELTAEFIRQSPVT